MSILFINQSQITVQPKYTVFFFHYLSGLRSSLCALLCARAPLALLLRCSSLFCWMRASSLEIVPIPNMESLIP